MRRALAGFVAAGAICVLGGCGGNSDLPELAPASGVVTLDNKPLEKARVMFHPEDGGARFSYGTTDADGNFKLSTFGMNDGGLVGSHKVTISKVAETAGSDEYEKAAASDQPLTPDTPGYADMMGYGKGGRQQTQKADQKVPEKYSDKGSTEIQATITADGPNEFTFNLESD
jgi:hypothetical protein